MSLKPLGMSCRANKPTLVSPFTVHFWVSQFGWQQWFMKRAWLPLGPASMIRSWKKKKLQTSRDSSWIMTLWGHQAQTHLVQCEHVEVTDIVLLGVSDAGSAFLLIDHFSHVLTHKGSLSSKRRRERRTFRFRIFIYTHSPWGKSSSTTFLMSDTARRPQPQDSVLYISTGVYWRFVKAWFWHRSPAAHTCGWHSYISMRLMHSESAPHGFSSDALQLQRGISERSAVMICTFPIGRFTWF